MGSRRNPLELAALVFQDERCLVYPDRIQHPEDRHGEEVVRIVSAPAAEKHAIRRCREQAMD